MESDIPNKTTNQLLVQHVSEAAVPTYPGFGIPDCNAAASALFCYNRQLVPGQPSSLLSPTSLQTIIRETERTHIAWEIHDEADLIEAMEWPGKEFRKRPALLMGGRFEINSSAGKGTTIVIDHFPAKERC